MVTRWQKLWLFLALVHVVFVGLGAFNVPLTDAYFAPLYRYYGRVTGASSGYAFFAPGVGSQLRATFEVYDKQGALIATVPMEKGTNREADLRIGNIIGWFWKDSSDRAIQRSMTASWAGKIFGRYPNAAEVVVLLDEYTMPSMEEYRGGKRAQWEKYYKARFARKTEAARG